MREREKKGGRQTGWQEKNNGNKRLIVSKELRSNGLKIMVKGNYTQEVVCSEVHDGDGAVLGEHIIRVGVA